MTFSGFQMQAIFTLANAMRLADGQTQTVEAVPMAIFSTVFGLSEEAVQEFMNNPMNPQAAVAIVGAMNDDQKRQVKELLVAIMDADGVRHRDEIKLLALLSSVCNLPS